MKQEISGQELVFPAAFRMPSAGLIKPFEDYFRGTNLTKKADNYSLKGRKISGKGRQVLEYGSRFCENIVDSASLKEAQNILSHYMKELKEYENETAVLAGKHEFVGTAEIPFLGGTAPITGDMTEKKPSGYASFGPSEKRKNEYIEELGKMLGDLHAPLNKAFENIEADENFGDMLNSLASEEKINFAQIATINSYVKKMLDDCSSVCNINKAFEESGMKGFHNVSEGKKEELLKKSNIKTMSKIGEKLSSLDISNSTGGAFLLALGGAAAVLEAAKRYFPEHFGTAALAASFVAVGGLGLSMYYLTRNNHIVSKEKECMEEIESIYSKEK